MDGLGKSFPIQSNDFRHSESWLVDPGSILGEIFQKFATLFKNLPKLSKTWIKVEKIDRQEEMPLLRRSPDRSKPLKEALDKVFLDKWPFLIDQGAS